MGGSHLCVTGCECDRTLGRVSDIWSQLLRVVGAGYALLGAMSKSSRSPEICRLLMDPVDQEKRIAYGLSKESLSSCSCSTRRQPSEVSVILRGSHNCRWCCGAPTQRREPLISKRQRTGEVMIPRQQVQDMYQLGAKHYGFTTIPFRLIGLRMKAFWVHA